MAEEISYRIAIEPIEHPVQVFVNGSSVADSQQAVVMHETHLPSLPYFPKADITPGLLEPSNLRTFCPFKGTANYWNLRTPVGLIENGAWSYEAPLDEAAEIAGYVAFDPEYVDDVSGKDLQSKSADLPFGKSALIDWIMRDAWECETPEELTKSFGDHLVETGMPLWRVNISIRTLHPALVARQYTWRRGTDGVETNEAPPETLSHPDYLNSPIKHVTDGLGGVRQRLDAPNPEFQFPIMDQLRRDGGTDYVAMPMMFSDGQINTISLASDSEIGFSTGHLGEVYKALFVLGRLFEVMVLRHNTDALFDAYLGERTRKQVLSGRTHRGDGEDIMAAIIFCDLRDSTQLAASLSRERYLGLLNDFFEAAAEPIIDRGGEVLKFIGDAVLAIFPIEGDSADMENSRASCARAMDAVEEMIERVAAIETGDIPSLRCAVGLHVGNVMYGNVGAPNRLDFTVTGTAVNVAARLSAQCKRVDKQLLVSSDVAQCTSKELVSLGKQEMRNVPNDIEVYALGSA
jgi:class 3 adenylate cyclase/uncharacterized protein (DUF427 family)